MTVRLQIRDGQHEWTVPWRNFTREVADLHGGKSRRPYYLFRDDELKKHGAHLKDYHLVFSDEKDMTLFLLRYS